MTDRFKMIAAVYLLLIKNEKILLLRRQNTGYEDGKYSVPAGHVEDNESLTRAFEREIKEEIGVTIHPADLKLVHVMHRKEKDIRTDFFFTAKKIKGAPKNMEPEKASDLSWFSLAKLPSNTIHYIRQAIELSQKGIFYSERGW